MGGDFVELFEVKRDCFAYIASKRGIGQCLALHMLYCRKENCNFYKSKEQYENELEEIKRRKKLCI